MTDDSFALLHQPRRPWIDPDLLQAAFVQLAAAQHPDRVHAAGVAEQERATRLYAALNSAHHCLREPRERLRHLLELEHWGKPAALGTAPAEIMDLFPVVGKICHDIDRFLATADPALSPLLRVERFEKAMAWTEQATQLLDQLRSRLSPLEGLARELNAVWDAAPPAGSPERTRALPLARLEQLYRAWSYLSRWMGQVQERVARLAAD